MAGSIRLSANRDLSGSSRLGRPADRARCRRRHPGRIVLQEVAAGHDDAEVRRHAHLLAEPVLVIPEPAAAGNEQPVAVGDAVVRGRRPRRPLGRGPRRDAILGGRARRRQSADDQDAHNGCRQTMLSRAQHDRMLSRPAHGCHSIRARVASAMRRPRSGAHGAVWPQTAARTCSRGVPGRLARADRQLHVSWRSADKSARRAWGSVIRWNCVSAGSVSAGAPSWRSPPSPRLRPSRQGYLPC